MPPESLHRNNLRAALYTRVSTRDKQDADNQTREFSAAKAGLSLTSTKTASPAAKLAIYRSVRRGR